MLTDTQVSNLAAAVNALRPDWPLKSLTTFVANNLRARAYRDTAVALAFIATDEKTKTPARVLEAGPWWKAGEGTETARPPRKAEECELHAGQWRDSCHGCASDRLTGEKTAPPELRRPDRDNHIARIRAELAQQAATRCPHHINRTRSRCADCERAESSEESNA